MYGDNNIYYERLPGCMLFNGNVFLCVDSWLQHVDTELSEDDVMKITSGTKTKAQVKVSYTAF